MEKMLLSQPIGMLCKVLSHVVVVEVKMVMDLVLDSTNGNKFYKITVYLIRVVCNMKMVVAKELWSRGKLTKFEIKSSYMAA